MTARTATTHRFPAARSTAPLLAPLHRLAARLRDLRQRRALAAELSELSDRELADIGITRASVPVIPVGLPYVLYR